MLDRAFLQMVEDLVACNSVRTCDVQRIIEIGNVEIAHTPGEDLARTDKLLEAGESFAQWDPAAPVEQIAVEAIGPEA